MLETIAIVYVIIGGVVAFMALPIFVVGCGDDPNNMRLRPISTMLLFFGGLAMCWLFWPLIAFFLL